MPLAETLAQNTRNPGALEALYREAQASREAAAFRSAVESLREAEPDNLLLEAWHYRLAAPADTEASPSINWLLAIALSLVTGLVFWVLSDETFEVLGPVPAFFHLWTPVATLFILGFFAGSSPANRRRAWLAGGALALATLYVLAVGRLDFNFRQQYAELAVLHLPFLSWAAVGLVLAGLRSAPSSRFFFIRKSLEVFVTGGLYLIAGMIFGGITVGMFAALDVELPELVIRFIAAGGAGILPLIAVASVYDPARPPDQQAFGQGVGRLVPILTHLLLPLALLVLLVYLAVIPFNFFAPFEDRGVLIVYNIMLFAVVGLLLGVTPITAEDLPAGLRPWVRRGVVTVAALAVVVSLYALAAVVSRTVAGGWTINRFTVIGWNLVNIGVLAGIVWTQLRLKSEDWTGALRRVFGRAASAYLVWGVGLMLLLPLLFAKF